MTKYLIQIILFSALLSATSYAQMNPIFEFKLHDDVIDAIVVKDGNIYTGSYDGYVKKTVLKTGEIITVLKQDDWIRSLLIVEDELIAAGNEGSIVGVDIQSEKQRWKIDAHKWWITGLAYGNGKLVSVSMDEHVKVWDIATKEKLFERKIEGTFKHQCICLKNQDAFIGSTSTVSHLSLGEEYNTSTAHYLGQTNTALSCSMKNADVILGLSIGSIIRIGKHKIQKRVHEAAIKALIQIDNNLYSASEDGTIIRSNADSLEESKLLYAGDKKVSALAEEGGLLYVGFADGTVKVFNLKEKF